MSSRFVPIGSGSNNECCVCGFVSVGSSCSGVCGQPNIFLYGNPTDDPPGTPGIPGEEIPCFPQSCCPCPSMETDRSVVLTLTAACAVGGVAETITLNKTDGLTICQHDNPGEYATETIRCYTTFGYGQMGKDSEYEKYGKKNHVFNNITVGGEVCAGAKADISLCCCGDYGSEVAVASTGDCHTCNYVLTIQFKPVDGSDYCHCPDGETHLLPGYINEIDGRDWFNQFQLISSNCKPLYLEYEANDLYWNCAPCLNGDGLGDDTVQLSATITEP